MFTGIVQAIGRIAEVNPKSSSTGRDVELRIDTDLDLSATALGDSIACSGCCLTVTRLQARAFFVDVSRETLDVTTLADCRVGAEVNLEKALRAGDALGGHYVSGHVDAVGEVVARHDDARSVRVEFAIPKTLGRYVARKGSICIDGVSLTVNGVSDEAMRTRFEVNLIPHTLERTTLQHYRAGTRVNIEIDMIARYLERLHAAS